MSGRALSNADTALYRAKREGRGIVRFYDVEMDRRTREDHALQHDLWLGIGRGELLLHYQPQARMQGEVVGFEALIRWVHPNRGLISPGSFIPAAEENRLIVAIGEWTLREACREAATWSTPLQIALNLSPVQFRHGDLPSLVHRVLLETGLQPSRLALEITKSALIGDFARALSVLGRLKMLGVQDRHGRFRHRIVVLVLSAGLSLRRDQDRPLLHHQSVHQPAIGGDRAGRDRACARPRPDRSWPKGSRRKSSSPSSRVRLATRCRATSPVGRARSRITPRPTGHRPRFASLPLPDRREREPY